MSLYDQLEERAGGASRAAKMIGIPYTSSYAAYKSGRRELPLYIERSMEAHLALSQREFDKLLKARLEGP